MRAKTQAKIRVLRHLHTLLALTLLVTLPLSAHAFCGFFVSGADSGLYNDATQVVLMRKGNRTVMSMSNTYKGPAEDFAMVVPVPVVLQKEQVKTLKRSRPKPIDRGMTLVSHAQTIHCSATTHLHPWGGGTKAGTTWLHRELIRTVLESCNALDSAARISG